MRPPVLRLHFTVPLWKKFMLAVMKCGADLVAVELFARPEPTVERQKSKYLAASSSLHAATCWPGIAVTQSHQVPTFRLDNGNSKLSPHPAHK
jgi:hypothetical protein